MREVGILNKKPRACRRSVTYADSSYTEKKEDRRSVFGAVVLLVRGAVTWFSRTQHGTRLSSKHAKYVSSANVTGEMLLRNQRRVLVTVFGDNNEAIKWAINPICTGRTKHLDVRCHFVWPTEGGREGLTCLDSKAECRWISEQKL